MRRGLVTSRSRAEAVIAAGDVLVNGAPADKAGRLVAASDALRLVKTPPYVSRAGEKLAALTRFGVDPAEQLALDVGASTGGFTDCLLQMGAAQVVAIDVGRGQLDPRLRLHPDVCPLERTDVRSLDAHKLQVLVAQHRPQWGVHQPVVADVITADLSFISVRSVADKLLELLQPAETSSFW